MTVPWRAPDPVSLPAGLAGALGVPPLVAELLYRRGYRTPAAARAFLAAGSPEEPLPELPGLAPLAARLLAAAQAGQPVWVQGAASADGVAAAAILLRCLQGLGAMAGHTVPGAAAAGSGPTVVLLAAPGLGLLPPDHPAHGLGAAAAAWLLARALLAAAGRPPAAADPWLPLAAIGLLAAGVPLVGAGRALAGRGLAGMRAPALPGLQALAQVAGLAAAGPVDRARELARRLEPGGDQEAARLAVRLLLSDTEAAARGLARQLELHHARRRGWGEPPAAAAGAAAGVGAPAGTPPCRPPAGPRTADLEVPLAGATRELYDALGALAPFGPGNPEPVLWARGVTVLTSRPAAGGQPWRLVLRQGEVTRLAVYNPGGELPVGPVDLAYRLEVDPWQGAAVLQLVVEAVQPAAGTAPPPPPRPHWEDRRGQHPHAVAAEFPGALVYREGPGVLYPGEVDRYRVGPCTVLVFLTPPPAPRVLAEVLALAAPARAVAAWPAVPAPPPPFPRTLLGLVRHALAHRGGTVTLAELAARTGELEQTVLAGLQALAASGFLTLAPAGPGRFSLARREPAGPARLAPGPHRDRLQALLRESAAFRRYLSRAPLAQVQALVE